jgi:hypothetical protein
MALTTAMTTAPRQAPTLTTTERQKCLRQLYYAATGVAPALVFDRRQRAAMRGYGKANLVAQKQLVDPTGKFGFRQTLVQDHKLRVPCSTQEKQSDKGSSVEDTLHNEVGLGGPLLT